MTQCNLSCLNRKNCWLWINLYLSTDTSSGLKNLKGKRPILPEHGILKQGEQNQVLAANVLANLQCSFHFRHHHAHMHGIYHPSTIFPPSWPLKMEWAIEPDNITIHRISSPTIQKYEYKGLAMFFIGLIFYLIIFLPFLHTFICWPSALLGVWGKPI